MESTRSFCLNGIMSETNKQSAPRRKKHKIEQPPDISKRVTSAAAVLFLLGVLVLFFFIL